MTNTRSLIERILFATDFSSCAEYAEASVTYLARAYGATVDVLHVLEIYEGMYVTTIQNHGETDERLADVIRRLTHSTVRATTQQKAGIPDVLICEAAGERRSDFIVLGTHGRTGLQHILLGSTAERTVAMAPCPVLTVREPSAAVSQPEKAAIRFKHVLVPIDFSASSLDALEYGIQIAKDFGGTLTLLHILEPLSYGIDLMLGHAAERNRERMTAQLTSVANMIRSHAVSVCEMLRGGAPVDSILDMIRASGCDLVVMGTHGRRGISRIVQGSVAAGVLRLAPCPVLTVKSLARVPDHQRVVPVEIESEGPSS